MRFMQEKSSLSTRRYRVGVRARRKQKKLPGKLRAIRKALDLTQPAVPEAFGIDWLRQSNVSDYEQGRREPPLSVLLLYAEAANVCLEVLVSDEFDLPKEIPAKKFYHPHK
jgi:transcriptional regulator with XRE-family HTH domain